MQSACICNSAWLLTSALNHDFWSMVIALHYASIQCHAATSFACCMRMQPILLWSVVSSAWKLQVQFGIAGDVVVESCQQSKSRHNASALGEAKPALSITFSVADAQEVLSEQKSIDSVTDTVTVGGAWCSVVDGFALLMSSSLEAGLTMANVSRYTMTVGSRTVDLPHLAFLATWVLPGEAEGNRNILCGEVGLDD